MIRSEIHARRPKWLTKPMAAAIASAFVLGAFWQPIQPAAAEVTEGEKRTTFLDGGVIANQTLQEQLVVLKRIDDRLARLEKALFEVVGK